MNEQGTTAPLASGLALFALVAAGGVIAVLLLGDTWSGWVRYPLVTAGILIATGCLGALVQVLRRDN
ncbi:hypothetical protein AB0L99_32455 [Streptomyces sp. NPDC051954]|uniref:hypothetical protein n=1 Tax=unclassified Streptomyces TaxID=2593676 RepID=UPI003429BF83